MRVSLRVLLVRPDAMPDNAPPSATQPDSKTREVNKVKRQVRKAVFPVAGLGTRFLPATKASPKEMLPIVDKPLIQYGVEEAVAAGVDTLVFIIGRTKNAIADHFDKAYELSLIHI